MLRHLIHRLLALIGWTCYDIWFTDYKFWFAGHVMTFDSQTASFDWLEVLWHLIRRLQVLVDWTSFDWLDMLCIHVISHDFVGTYRYWAPKYESRPTDRNSRYIWILIFRFCQKLKLVFRSPQTLALSKFTTGSGNRTLLVFRNR